MSDDSFIREVDEELRSDRFQAFWKSYGKIVIVAALAVVLGTAANRYWEYSSASKSAAMGDSFMAAVKLAENGKADEALSALQALEDTGSPAYKTMARLRAAAEHAAKGNAEAALKNYDEVIADVSADENFRAMARLRAGLLLVDSGTVAEVESRVSPLTGPGAPYRASAREALGLAYYKAGELKKAFSQFESISNDIQAPSAMQQRVRIMLALIASNGGPILKKP